MVVHALLSLYQQAGYSMLSFRLPTPIDCRCREIFIRSAAVFPPYSHIYLCTAAISTTHLTRNWIDDLRGETCPKRETATPKKKEIKKKSLLHFYFFFLTISDSFFFLLVLYTIKSHVIHLLELLKVTYLLWIGRKYFVIHLIY